VFDQNTNPEKKSVKIRTKAEMKWLKTFYLLKRISEKRDSVTSNQAYASLDSLTISAES